MKYVRQFTIFVSVCFIGEIIHRIIPLPIPSPIYGLVLMFLALEFKIMPLDKIEEISDSLLEIMPLLFVPSTAGLLVAWPVIKKYWFPILIIGIAGTMLVFFVTGRVTQFFEKKFRKRISGKNVPQIDVEAK